MAPQGIVEELNRQPFKPFRVFVSDGVAYDVRRPSDAYMRLTELTIGIDPDVDGWPTNSVYIAPNDVTRIIPIDPEAPPEASTDGDGQST